MCELRPVRSLHGKFVGDCFTDFVGILDVENERIDIGQGNKLVGVWSRWEDVRSIVGEAGLDLQNGVLFSGVKNIRIRQLLDVYIDCSLPWARST